LQSRWENAKNARWNSEVAMDGAAFDVWRADIGILT
jgi:hypothetical protein